MYFRIFLAYVFRHILNIKALNKSREIDLKLFGSSQALQDYMTRIELVQCQRFFGLKRFPRTTTYNPRV